MPGDQPAQVDAQRMRDVSNYVDRYLAASRAALDSAQTSEREPSSVLEVLLAQPEKLAANADACSDGTGESRLADGPVPGLLSGGEVFVKGKAGSGAGHSATLTTAK